MTQLHLIYARARNGVIGHKGLMPWHLPEDLAHFKQRTMGHPVVMGRKTWESIPGKFRPLPGRTNIVVTRDPLWKEDGAIAARSLEEAIRACGQAEEVWVMGGAQIYALALPFASSVLVTEIDADFEGDAHAPTLDPAEWREVRREPHASASGLPFAFVSYLRKRA